MHRKSYFEKIDSNSIIQIALRSKLLPYCLLHHCRKRWEAETRNFCPRSPNPPFRGTVRTREITWTNRLCWASSGPISSNVLRRVRIYLEWLPWLWAKCSCSARRSWSRRLLPCSNELPPHSSLQNPVKYFDTILYNLKILNLLWV